MSDPRNTQLASIFIEHSLNVQAGDNLVICTSDLEHMDLIQQCFIKALNKDANVFLDIMGFNFALDRSSAGDLVHSFYKHANSRQIENPPTIYQDITSWGDKFLRLTSHRNYNQLAEIDSEKIQNHAKAVRPWFDTLLDKEWVLSYLPNNAMAQQAKLSLTQLEDIYYEAVLIDYEEMKTSQTSLEKTLDNGEQVHITGERTDLRFSIKGRTGKKCYGKLNVPDGEVYTGPVEDSAQGYIYFDFPGIYAGKEIADIYLEFKDGKVIKAESSNNQEALEKVLHTDKGARYLGEFSFVTNYGIQRYIKNLGFDEKIGGTIHLALGRSYNNDKGWGKNKSAIHWDIVKDMRQKGSKVEIDGETVLQDGRLMV